MISMAKQQWGSVFRGAAGANIMKIDIKKILFRFTFLFPG